MTACARSTRIVRKLEAESARPIGILVDLQGPKLRIGKFESGAHPVDRRRHAELRPPRGDRRARPRTPAASRDLRAVKPGHTLLLDDGKFRLRVVEASDVRHRRRGADRRQCSAAARASACPTPWCPSGRLPTRIAPISNMRCRSASTGSLSRSCSAPRTSPRRASWSRGRAAIMAKIEKPSALSRSQSDHRPRRRHHGGARRPRRRDAGREGAGPAEADHSRRAQRRQAGRRGDADARNR